MSLLKQKIMESAMRLISEKGYESTSIQDIANDCGIAKGSVYKIFESKEDLLIAVFGSLLERMFDETEAILSDEELPPRDRLIRSTRHQLNYFEEMKFSLGELQELPLKDHSKFMSACHEWRGRQLEYYKEMLLTAYGAKIEPRVWDLVIVYASILKVLTMFPHSVNQPLNHEHAAAFIVERLDDMAAGLAVSKLEPLLPESMMEEYVLAGSPAPAGQRKEELFEALIAAVQELNVPNGRREELIEAARLLRDEAEKEEPRRIHVRVLTDFLQSQHELKYWVSQLNKLLG
ncbi:TetR family transcriptional regulator [Cohnella sp. CFH 77786]|uniref:TetR/AcrR family transcriptional regulator n=1 Tax=Cohnella sp. CFH 77786 TaxID=2662265 RepID=UPI001C608FE1|nr:TetR/AcrR family transcriptional regulator [Cohnella sp. CFH 77786]MBW5448566.1 TetR family transcriptional regulator [Cohnella sp. CFH 77786]